MSELSDEAILLQSIDVERLIKVMHDGAFLRILDDNKTTASVDPFFAALVIKSMRQVIGYALADMGRDGHSVCGGVKALLRLAYGNAADPDDAPDYTMEEAVQVAISCDEMHGRRSVWRIVAAAQAALAGKE